MLIASKFRYFTLLCIVIASISIGFVGFWGNTAVIRSLQDDSMQQRSALEVDRLSTAFRELDHDIQFIGNLPQLDELVNAIDTDDSDVAVLKDGLAMIFQDMLEAKLAYTQIRILTGDSGKEVIRVDYRDGQTFRRSEEELQMKGNRGYYREIRTFKPGEVYHSAIDLNRENGEIEVPHQPMLRVGVALFDTTGNFYGVAMINLRFDVYVRSILKSTAGRERYQYYLTNQEGYYLYHPDRSCEFGFDLGHDSTVQNEFPELSDVWDDQADSATFRTGSFLGLSGDLVHFQWFNIFNSDRRVVLGLKASYDDIARSSISLSLWMLFAILLLVIIALSIAYWFSGRLTQPLQLIDRVSRQIARNEGDVSLLPVERCDEIGQLAVTFKEMKAAIDREQYNLHVANSRLSQANEDLEHFAHISSHEMREPIRRITGLASLYQIECEDGRMENSGVLLDQLKEECGRALAQIADFREFSRLTKDQTMVREEVSLQGIVDSVLQEFEPMLVQRKVQVECDQLPPVQVYPRLLRVVYRNLVENALTHSNGDSVQLRFTYEKERESIDVFGVRNTGSELKRSQYRAVFDLFKRLDHRNTGTGVGLAICKRIIDRHSGSIWVESGPDYVHFKFTLTTIDYASIEHQMSE